MTDFQNYIQKLSQQVGDAAQVKQIIANAVTLISIGNNDIAITYFATPAKKLQYNIETYTDQLIAWKATFIQVCKAVHHYIFLLLYISIIFHVILLLMIILV